MGHSSTFPPKKDQKGTLSSPLFFMFLGMQCFYHIMFEKLHRFQTSYFLPMCHIKTAPFAAEKTVARALRSRGSDATGPTNHAGLRCSAEHGDFMGFQWHKFGCFHQWVYHPKKETSFVYLENPFNGTECSLRCHQT